MTQSSLQTHCPKCDTRFRVTDAQLSVANGKVRCGNCMSVFNAIEHQIDEATPPEKKPAPAADTGSPPQTEDDLLFADNPEEDATEGTYTGTRLTFSDDELSDSFRSMSQVNQNKGFVAEENEESSDSIDESWAEAMLSDNDEKERKPAPDPAPRQNKKPEPEPEPEPTPEPEPRPSKKKPEHDYDGFFIDEPAPSASDREEPAAFDHDEHRDFDYDVEDDPKHQAGISASESPYHDLRREPVGVSGGGSGRLRGFLWFLVILALLGGLVSQVVWYQFDRLSAIPQLRPFYVQGCEIFGCELEPLVDVHSIQSRKLVVKTNPENRNQLLVDAVIINRASFEQPFPAIALTFSNLNNDVVAQSVFTPEEYLAGDGQDLEAMPTDRPVRILINILDPGKDAVNYNIAFQAYTP